ncbi:hypothetical protein AB83_4149 [Escherichia coli 2-011-08_S3_C1]|nr:hypothetical protein AB83_4149 [Escherichia coli 2-011-08_S3_C1]
MCDINHINIGGREVIDVTFITKRLCKKSNKAAIFAKNGI